MERFFKAQIEDYPMALVEIRNGKKVGHWIWYIFPQIHGLGYSIMSKTFEIKSRKEAEEYYNQSLLRGRLKEITLALLQLQASDIVDVLGKMDAKKVQSCMTLFYEVSKDPLFKEVIDTYYDGIFDQRTIQILKEEE